MNAVKLHLLGTVVATQVVALYDGAVPYFPIEISRTAASSANANRALATGFATLIVTMLYTKTLDAVTFAMWLGLMIVALVPDTRNWSLHMLGVAIVFAAALAHVYRHRDVSLVPPVLCAGVVYLIRLVLKAVVMLMADAKVRAAVSQSWSALFAAMFERTMDVMMRGPLAYNDDNTWAMVGPVFKVCGVLQWVAFYALSFVL